MIYGKNYRSKLLNLISCDFILRLVIGHLCVHFNKIDSNSTKLNQGLLLDISLDRFVIQTSILASLHEIIKKIKNHYLIIMLNKNINFHYIDKQFKTS